MKIEFEAFSPDIEVDLFQLSFLALVIEEGFLSLLLELLQLLGRGLELGLLLVSLLLRLLPLLSLFIQSLLKLLDLQKQVKYKSSKMEHKIWR